MGDGVTRRSGLDDTASAYSFGVATRSSAKRLAARGAGRLSATARDRLTAEIRLEMPAGAARTHRAALAHHHVPDFAREPPRTPVWLAAQEKRAAHSGAQRDHHEVTHTLGRAVPGLPDPSAVPVVVEDDVVTGAQRDERAYVHAGQRQVRAPLDRLLEKVHLGRQADADPGDLRGLRSRRHLGSRADDRVDDRARVVARSECLRLRDHAPVTLHEAGGDVRPAHVDSDGVPGSHRPSQHERPHDVDRSGIVPTRAGHVSSCPCGACTRQRAVRGHRPSVRHEAEKGTRDVRALFIGGTGMISSAVSRAAIDAGFELHVLNRGAHSAPPTGARALTADIHRIDDVREALGDLEFDVVVDWIAYTPDDVERDLELFSGRTGQYVFVSSASVYEKPPSHYLITESTPLRNPYWQYSRNKIACEERLMRACRSDGFPVTIVRPSMTYDRNLPIALGGWGTYTLADRLLSGRPIIVHGDGSSLWVVTHADDLAKGLLGLLGNEGAVGEAFHITSDEVLTWNQIYQTIAEALGVEAQTSCTCRPTSSRMWHPRWPGACSVIRRGAWCSTTARSRRPCLDSRPRSRCARVSAGRWSGSPPTSGAAMSMSQ